MAILEELYKNCSVKISSGDMRAIDELFELFQKNGNKRVFRGVTKDKELFPSILRVEEYQEKMDCESFLHYEHALYQEFVKNTIQYLPYYAYPEDLLACGQHYGLKTRLLDWTSNPLVALFFVCNDFENDSYILSYETIKAIEKEEKKEEKEEIVMNSLLYFSRTIDNSDSEPDERLRILFANMDYFDGNGCANSSVFQQNEMRIDLDLVGAIKKGKIPFLIRTHDANQRIIAQQGLFEFCRFEFSCGNIKAIKNKHIENIGKNVDEIYKIRKEEKKLIKDRLKDLGYNRIRLFPDLASACQYSNEVMREEFFRKSTLQPKNRRQTMQRQL